MNISVEQRRFLENCVKQGMNMSHMQDAYNKEYHTNLTYMDIRCLVADLELDLNESSTSIAKAKEDEKKIEDQGVVKPGKVQVSVDPVARPGVLFNGNVTFSDGMKASWHLDSMGRLGLVPTQKGYRPSQEDLQEFQSAIQAELQKNGM